MLELYSDAEKSADASVALVLDMSRRLSLAPDSIDTASVVPIMQRLTEFAMRKFQVAGRAERSVLRSGLDLSGVLELWLWFYSELRIHLSLLIFCQGGLLQCVNAAN